MPNATATPTIRPEPGPPVMDAAVQEWDGLLFALYLRELQEQQTALPN